MAAAATDLANIGSTVREANAAAAVLTTGLVPAAEDEVSAAIAGLFGNYANEFQSLGAQAAAFHDRLVQTLSAAAGAYAATEAAGTSVLQAAQQDVVNAVNRAGRTATGVPADRAPEPSVSAGTALSAVIAAPLTAVGTTLVMGGSGDPFPTSSFQNAVNNLFIQITPGLEGSIPLGQYTPEQFYPFGGPNELTLAASVSLGHATPEQLAAALYCRRDPGRRFRLLPERGHRPRWRCAVSKPQACQVRLCTSS